MSTTQTTVGSTNEPFVYAQTEEPKQNNQAETNSYEYNEQNESRLSGGRAIDYRTKYPFAQLGNLGRTTQRPLKISPVYAQSPVYQSRPVSQAEKDKLRGKGKSINSKMN